MIQKNRVIGEAGAWTWLSERGLDSSGKLIKREKFEIRNLKNPQEVLHLEEKKNICYPE